MNWTGLSREAGAVTVFVAVMLLPLFLVIAFAIDGSWYWVHKRHLQTQVDAGVFAGASGPWFPSCNDNPADPNSIVGKALRYSGDLNRDPQAFNEQYSDMLADKLKVHVLVNSGPTDDIKYYWPNSTVDYTDDASPCASLAAGNGHLELKATDSKLPLFLPIPGLNILSAHARARVGLFQLNSASGALPVAVPDPNPVDGAVLWVDETTSPDNPAIIARARLFPGAFKTLNGKYLAEWSTLTTDVRVQEKTGAIIAFTGNPDWTWTSGTVTEICGQALVECYQGLDDPATAHIGLGFVHGFPQTSGAVTVRDVYLTNSTCGDDSAPYFVLNGGCNVGIKAEVQFPDEATDIKVSVENGDAGCQGGQPPGCALTLAADGYWTGNGILNIPGGAGALDLTINWRYKLGGGQPISNGVISQRVYSASDDPLKSGPVEYVSVQNPTGGERHSEENGNVQFVVKVGIQGKLEYQSTLVDSNGTPWPPTRLRVTGGSQNQSLDCDPGYNNLADELANGCRPAYAINTGSPDCRTLNQSALWSSPQPWKCVAIDTGDKTNQVPKGLNRRVLLSEKPSVCPPPGANGHNNWDLPTDGLGAADADGKPDYDPSNDRRLLLTFVTPFGSFTGSGSDVKPVRNFAMFYVSGWTGQGQGFDNPCQGNGDDPAPSQAYIVGHFVKYVGSLPGGGGADPCIVTDPSVIAPCVAVLTD